MLTPQARAAQHLLEQAERAARARLARAELVNTTYAFLLRSARSALSMPADSDADAVRSAVLDAGARVAMEAAKTVGSVDALRATRPLHMALIPARESTDAADAEALDERQQWEKGRDEYLNWEANRVLASMKRDVDER